MTQIVSVPTRVTLETESLIDILCVSSFEQYDHIKTVDILCVWSHATFWKGNTITVGNYNQIDFCVGRYIYYWVGRNTSRSLCSPRGGHFSRVGAAYMQLCLTHCDKDSRTLWEQLRRWGGVARSYGSSASLPSSISDSVAIHNYFLFVAGRSNINSHTLNFYVTIIIKTIHSNLKIDKRYKIQSYWTG